MRIFDSYIWRERRRVRLDVFEKKRKSELIRLDEVLKQLGTAYHWDAVYLFGSIIRPGGFRPDSDIDVGIQGLDKLQLYAFIGDISAALDRDVDVVRMEECPFAEMIIKRGVKWNPGKKSPSF